MFGTIKQSSMDLDPSKTFPKWLLKLILRQYVSDLFLIDYIDMKKFILDKKKDQKRSNLGVLWLQSGQKYGFLSFFQL